MNRLQAGSAAVMEPLAPAAQAIDQALKEDYARTTGQPAPAPLAPVPRMKSIPEQAKKVGRALVLGESPLPGVKANMAMDELVRRTGGEYHALSSEQADAISRASLGLPTGEIARALTGNEGISLLAQGPVGEVMNAVGGGLYPIARAAVGKIPPVGRARALGDIKTKAVRRTLAEQAESALELDPARKATEAIAKQTGETFQQVDARIRDAMERAPQTGGQSLLDLPLDEYRVAAIYARHGAGQVAQDVSEGLRPGVLGSHIEAQRVEALRKIEAANPVGPFGPRKITRKQIAEAQGAVRQFEKTVAPSGIAAPRFRGNRIDLEGAKQVLERTPQMLVGDAPRAIVPEAAERLAEIRNVPGRGSAASRAGRFTAAAEPIRKGNRAATALEKEAAFQAEAGPAKQGLVSRLLGRTPEERQLYRTTYESALKRGDRRALRRASAGMLRDVGDEFGVQGPREGYVPLTSIRMGKTGFARPELQRLSQIYVPRKIAVQVERMNSRMSTATMGDAANFWKKAAQSWKTYVLTRTGYPIRNFADNAITVWLAGGKAEHIPDAIKAVLVSQGKGNANEYIPALRMTVGQYVKEARRNGTLSGGFLGTEVGISGKNPLARASQSFGNANSFAEQVARATLDLTERSAGRSAVESGRLVDDMLGKYHPAFFSPAEQAVRTYAAPWYAWLKQVVKRGVRATIERPGSVGKAESAIAEINRSQGYTPEQVASLGPSARGDVPIVRPSKERGAKPSEVEAFPTSFYGLRDLNRIFGARELGPLAILINPVGQLYPPAQWLAAVGGIDTFRGSTFTGENVELPGIARRVPRDLWPELGIKPVGTELMGPDRLAFFLRQSGPAGIAVGDLGSTNPDAARRARAFWTGFSSMVKDLEESKRGDIYMERGARKSQIETLKRSRRNEAKSLQRQSRFAPDSTFNNSGVDGGR